MIMGILEENVRIIAFRNEANASRYIPGFGASLIRIPDIRQACSIYTEPSDLPTLRLPTSTWTLSARSLIFRPSKPLFRNLRWGRLENALSHASKPFIVACREGRSTLIGNIYYEDPTIRLLSSASGERGRSETEDMSPLNLGLALTTTDFIS